MPVQYTSILDEHAAVRQAVGIFDISHMGQVVVEGVGAEAWLNRLLTNQVAKLAVGEGQYSMMLNERGGVIDDLILYREGESRYFVVINASMIDEDVAWMRKHLADGVSLENQSPRWAGMAIQGPESAVLYGKLFEGCELPGRNRIERFESVWGEVVVCRTGYTGEDGFEFFCAAERGEEVFQAFVDGGAKPCGLGARDSLRLEMCYPLNGSDLSPERTPLEAGLGFFVDLEKGDFIGREVLAAQKEEGVKQKLVAMEYLEKGAPPRAHYPVVNEAGEVVGELTSGVLSPSLSKGIGMGYLPVELTRPGTLVAVDVRGRKFPAKVVKKPFYKAKTAKA